MSYTNNTMSFLVILISVIFLKFVFWTCLDPLPPFDNFKLINLKLIKHNKNVHSAQFYRGGLNWCFEYERHLFTILVFINNNYFQSTYNCHCNGKYSKTCPSHLVILLPVHGRCLVWVVTISTLSWVGGVFTYFMSLQYWQLMW